MPAAPTKAEAPASTLASLRQSITTLQLHPTLAPLVLLALVGARTSPDAAARGCVIRLPAEASSTDVASVTTALRNVRRRPNVGADHRRSAAACSTCDVTSCRQRSRPNRPRTMRPTPSPAAASWPMRTTRRPRRGSARPKSARRRADAEARSAEPVSSPTDDAQRTASPSHDLPDVLILPHLDREAPSAQRALMQALRDRKFSLQPRGHDDGGIFPLPKTMVPIAVVRGEPSNVDPLTIWGLSRHLVRARLRAPRSHVQIDRFALSYTCTAVDVAALNEQPGQLASTPLFRAHVRLTLRASRLIVADRRADRLRPLIRAITSSRHLRGRSRLRSARPALDGRAHARQQGRADTMGVDMGQPRRVRRRRSSVEIARGPAAGHTRRLQERRGSPYCRATAGRSAGALLVRLRGSGSEVVGGGAPCAQRGRGHRRRPVQCVALYFVAKSRCRPSVTSIPELLANGLPARAQIILSA